MNRLRVWGPAAAWAVLLFALSARSSIPGPVFPYGDKLGHFALYGVLGALLGFGWLRSPKAISHGVLLIIGALYGLSDEWHQMYVPGRMPDVADWIADVAGLLSGYAWVVTRSGRTEDAIEQERSA